jgi:hypothetical protein
MQMITRREAVRLLGSASAGAWYAATQTGFNFALSSKAAATRLDSTPTLASGTPKSPERLALIDVFLKRSEGLQNKFEAREHKSDWVMPYRLFHPETTRKAPLVLYLHGGGGLGDDNLKQLSLGNRFGTRVWLLPENQKRFPCYVLAPQTDRGWIRYDFATTSRNSLRRSFQVSETVHDWLWKSSMSCVASFILMSAVSISREIPWEARACGMYWRIGRTFSRLQ